MVGKETSQVKPTNRIVLDNQNIHTQTKKVETATSMYAGRLVKAGTNDDDIVVATGSNTGYAWLGYEQTHKKDRPATVGTIYLVNAQAAVINGPGIILVAHLGALNPAIGKDTLLTGAASGTVTPGVAGTDDIVAMAEEYVAAAAAGTILVRSRI